MWIDLSRIVRFLLEGGYQGEGVIQGGYQLPLATAWKWREKLCMCLWREMAWKAMRLRCTISQLCGTFLSFFLFFLSLCQKSCGQQLVLATVGRGGWAVWWRLFLVFGAATPFAGKLISGPDGKYFEGFLKHSFGRKKGLRLWFSINQDFWG